MNVQNVLSIAVLVALAAVCVTADTDLAKVIETVIDKQVSNPDVAAKLKAKLPELKACLPEFRKMSSTAGAAALQTFLPAAAECKSRIKDLSDKQQRIDTIRKCMDEAAGEFKSMDGVTTNDANHFDAGVECVRAIIRPAISS